MSKRDEYMLRIADGIRRYCWRVGAVIASGDPCVECGSSHEPFEHQDQCGAFVKHGDHGHHCDLPVGHSGGHSFTNRVEDEDG